MKQTKHLLHFLYLYSVCNFVSQNDFSISGRNDQRVVEFLKDADCTAFMNVHIVHSFHNFWQSEHPFDRISASLTGF